MLQIALLLSFLQLHYDVTVTRYITRVSNPLYVVSIIYAYTSIAIDIVDGRGLNNGTHRWLQPKKTILAVHIIKGCLAVVHC